MTDAAVQSVPPPAKEDSSSVENVDLGAFLRLAAATRPRVIVVSDVVFSGFRIVSCRLSFTAQPNEEKRRYVIDYATEGPTSPPEEMRRQLEKLTEWLSWTETSGQLTGIITPPRDHWVPRHR